MTVDPHDVHSPRSHWRLINVLYDGGPTDDDHRGWSVATGTWDGKKRLGIRWNGGSDDNLGQPNAFNNPTWFIVPGEMEAAVLDAVKRVETEDKLWTKAEDEE